MVARLQARVPRTALTSINIANMDLRPKSSLNIRTLAETGKLFRRKLQAIKDGAAGIAWYPYDSLASLDLLDQVLTGDSRRLPDPSCNEPILDIGCGDGDLSFLLESLGFTVHALDYAPNNFNGMRGIEFLKDVLHSNVSIHSTDLDSTLDLPHGNFGLVLLLGVIYHLKNPLGLLSELARRASYCILSTRTMQLAPDKRQLLQHLPIAYLLDRDELNDDETNYWIFTEAGLRRMLDRAQWEVLDLGIVGEQSWSDPHSLANDARAFCLARSRLLTDPAIGSGLLQGWHHLENGCRRWTDRRFSVALKGRKSPRMAAKLRFIIPTSMLTRLGPFRLSARANGLHLPERFYETDGEHVYREEIPTAAMAGSEVRIDFDLDRALPPQDGDQRELGVLVNAVAFEPLYESRDAIDPIYMQQAHIEERLVACQERVREADRTIEQRSEWALKLQHELDIRNQELQRCLQLLQEAERTAVERSEWALNVQRELDSQAGELSASNRLLAIAEVAVAQRSRELEEARCKVKSSRWIQLGRMFGLGPSV
jgi:tRNA (mo5U34)-methyltransferase